MEHVNHKCGELKQGTNFLCMRLTDNMMAYTDTNNKTSYIFSDPIIYEIIYGEMFTEILKNETIIDCDEVCEYYEIWKEAHNGYPLFENEIKVYLHPCSTIPYILQKIFTFMIM